MLMLSFTLSLGWDGMGWRDLPQVRERYDGYDGGQAGDDDGT